jgi:eukaryotic-like serine/threonine-protein kinase
VSADRWQDVERLYHDAMRRADDEREAFLDGACGGDDALRREVASLVGFDRAAEGFLDRSVLEDAVRQLAQSDEPLPPPGRIGDYQILSTLGAGGMGVVYRARDVRLEREVALKVLAGSMASDPGYRRRFEEEARAASGLNHPNIVTIYGVGEAGGLPYIAMELVQGRTLSQVLTSGALPLAAAVDISLPLAEALAAAHAAGVVHRDLKPENVMVTVEGLLKVLDFGIAKRGRATDPSPALAPRAPAAGMVTEPGAILGTAGYMSPEQASGLPAGPASDQFSFGAILYEMLAGRRAFERPTKSDAISAIIGEDPAPVGLPRTAVTARLQRVLERCLAKDPEHRYHDTHELALELRCIRDVSRARTSATGLTRRRAMWLAGAAAVGAAAGLEAWRRWPGGTGIRSLAVLPFVNATEDEDADYLCDGLTDGLIHRLSQLPSLRVMARSLVLNFKGKTGDPRAVGRQLGVEAILTGTLARRSGRLLVTAELVEVATGAQLWSDTYDRAAADTLFVQDEMAGAILERGLHLTLHGQELRRFTRRPTEDVEAYELYLRAVHAFESGTENDYLNARDLLNQALARDSAFALAYAALATTYAVLAVDGFARPRDAWAESSRSVRRALERDGDLPDAHAAAASVAFFFDWDWSLAEREWNTALRSHGGDIEPTFLTAYALQQWALGHLDAALDLARRARMMDPLSPAFVVREADLLFQARRLEAAAGLYEKAIRDTPDDPAAYFGLAETRREQNRFDEAIDCRRRAHGLAGDDGLREVLSTARGADGYLEIERMTARLQLELLGVRAAGGGYASPLDSARAYAALGDRDRALRCLDAAFVDRAPGLVFLAVDRAWDAIRADPAFAAAVHRVGLR